MDPWQAFVLGVIEGITEYLPVSSTGHLLVAQHLMGIGAGSAVSKAAADAFAICIQGGAILAVAGLYWQRMMQMLRGCMGSDADGRRLVMSIVIGFLPAALIGLLCNDWIESRLFGTWPVVAAWVVGGILILVTAWWARRGPGTGEGRELLSMTWRMALVIGLMQCVAMWPGTSRSLMTIVGGLLVGLSMRAAVEYSFLLGMCTLTAATVKKALWPVAVAGDEYDRWFGGLRLMSDHYGTTPMVVGVAAATVSAAIAVKWLVSYLQRNGLSMFGWYRIAIGCVIGGLVIAGIVPA